MGGHRPAGLSGLGRKDLFSVLALSFCILLSPTAGEASFKTKARYSLRGEGVRSRLVPVYALG